MKQPDLKPTRREVLLRCLGRREMEILDMSVYGHSLEPKRGYETDFFLAQQDCEVLRDLIQALECEPVRAVLAAWREELEKHQKEEAKKA